MRFLLDTHSLIWWRTKSVALTTRAVEAVGDPASTVYVSAASAWEIATKFRLGKLRLAEDFITNFLGDIRFAGFLQLPVTVEHGLKAGSLEGAHKDPFDRMLIAQALEEGLTLVSNETAFDRFGVKRLW